MFTIVNKINKKSQVSKELHILTATSVNVETDFSLFA